MGTVSWENWHFPLEEGIYEQLKRLALERVEDFDCAFNVYGEAVQLFSQPMDANDAPFADENAISKRLARLRSQRCLESGMWY